MTALVDAPILNDLRASLPPKGSKNPVSEKAETKDDEAAPFRKHLSDASKKQKPSKGPKSEKSDAATIEILAAQSITADTAISHAMGVTEVTAKLPTNLNVKLNLAAQKSGQHAVQSKPNTPGASKTQVAVGVDHAKSPARPHAAGVPSVVKQESGRTANTLKNTTSEVGSLPTADKGPMIKGDTAQTVEMSDPAKALALQPSLQKTQVQLGAHPMTAPLNATQAHGPFPPSKIPSLNPSLTSTAAPLPVDPDGRKAIVNAPVKKPVGSSLGIHQGPKFEKSHIGEIKNETKFNVQITTPVLPAPLSDLGSILPDPAPLPLGDRTEAPDTNVNSPPVSQVSAAGGETQNAVAAPVQASQNVPSSAPSSTGSVAQFASINTENANWIEEVQAITAILNQDGVEEIELTLSPENLGRVQIRLEIREGVTGIFVVTETPEAAKLFNDHKLDLASAFNEQGLDMAEHQAHEHSAQDQSDTPKGDSSMPSENYEMDGPDEGFASSNPALGSGVNLLA